jgi:AhpD family alkylhydroperoxidase
MVRERYSELAPDAYRALMQLTKLMHESSIERSLVHLVYLRVSQINGCAFCVDRHTNEALADGEDAQRLHTLLVWRETPFFSPREGAALAWAEAMTRLPDAAPAEALHEETRRHFSEKEFVDLTFAVATINALNRLGVGFRGRPMRRKKSA